MVSGVCHDCGGEYEKLRQHWAMSDCEEDPEKSSKVDVNCENCGKTHTEWRYRVEKNGVSYCSPECRDEGRRNGEIRECDWCGKETYVHNCHLDNAHHFCDRECSSKWRSEEFSGDGHPQWGGGKATATCERCGDKYEIWPTVKEQSKYCSWSCKQAPETETRKCGNCGEDITRPKWEFKGERAFCDADCYSKWMSEFQRGSKNPAWKGGKGGITAVRRMLGDRSWDAISRDVRANAGHVCEMCGRFQPHRKLSGHHIIPVSSGGTHADELLMALCEVCHPKAENFIDQYTEPHLLKFAE